MSIFNRWKRILASALVCTLLSAVLTVPAAAAGFQDVPAGHWAATEIQECVELGFFKGQSSAHFGLGQPMTRAAFSVVLCRFFGWDTPAPAYPTFSDVPVTDWYAGAVEAAFTHGAFTRQDAQFRPSDPITREELTVTLLRAMGYSTLAGLAAEDSIPFEDVSENAGYISLAYSLGLMNGTSATTFSPERQATREQVAVILMRLYRKLHQASPEQVAILNATETAPDFTGVSVAAIPAGRLLYIGGQPKVNGAMAAETASMLQQASRNAGIPTLLHVTGGSTALKGSASATAAVLVSAVTEGSYDGLFLDIPKLKSNKAQSFTALARELRQQLGARPLYLTVEAPSRNETAYTGYDFRTLSTFADRLVLRIAPYTDIAGKLMLAPVDPLEDIFYAASTLRTAIPAEKISLLLQTGNAVWKGLAQADSLTQAEFEDALESGDFQLYYSERYACAYLSGTADYNASTVIWYLNGSAAAERVQMVRLLGIDQICISDFSTASGDVLSGLK